MNSNLDSYLSTVITANTEALSEGQISLAASIPCLVARELEPLNNKFIDSSDPFMTSYRALRRIQRIAHPPIPRKIEFESVVYLKEGIIDCIFPNSPVTLIFIGDGNSDKRFSYNCYRLFKTFQDRFRIYSFICNADLIGRQLGADPLVKAGWNETEIGDRLYYHAKEWSELNHFLELVSKETTAGRQVLVLVDIDGTYLCPRPHYYPAIKDARRDAIAALCREVFERAIFDPQSSVDVARVRKSYDEASETTFSRTYDDEDLSMLIALGLYTQIIDKGDLLLNPTKDVGFTEPIEWLQYASFLIENNPAWESSFRGLRALYTRCADAIQQGSPTVFEDFRHREEEFLIARASRKEINLNRQITQFLVDCAVLRAVPIAFSDRPNASLGLDSMSTHACTAIARPDALVSEPLVLVG